VGVEKVDVASVDLFSGGGVAYSENESQSELLASPFVSSTNVTMPDQFAVQEQNNVAPLL
jgi:hypothetical protein